MTDVYRLMRRLAANQFRPAGEELGSVRRWAGCSGGECKSNYPTLTRIESRLRVGHLRGRLLNALELIAGGGEGGEQVVHVLVAARLHRQVNGGVAEIYAELAIVRGLHDVGAVVGEYSGENVQRAGIIRQVDAQAD